MSDEKQLKRDVEAARLRFVRAIREAKRDGVNVAQIFVEVEEQIMLAKVRILGLSLSVLSTFACPIAVVWLKIYCAIHNYKIDIPETAAYGLSAMGFVSILAFGFDLVDPRSLTSFMRRRQQLESPRLDITLELPKIDGEDDDNAPKN